MRAALPEVGGRFADLLTGIRNPDARSLGEWSIAETAAHVGMIALMYTGMIRGDGGPLPLPGLAAPIDSVSVDAIAEMNALALRLYPERDPLRLAERLRTDIAQLLLVSADLDPEKPVWWLGGSRVPVAGVLAHLVNELLIHGLDIARAAGRPWRIPARLEALFLELFLFGMVRNDMGRLLDDAKPAARRIAVEFRSSYTAPAVLALQHGRLRLEAPDGTADLRLKFDPAVLVPMMFGRISRLRAALLGGVWVSGPRPWLLPEFLRTVRMP
ncbi:maleylpyruvate isomerase N-terminal domain-containing protein [Amycolatopsis vancoresmycina]|uniref:maleylpyruvate isomerase N-terminal domain-containing protein n=1 Tax=Amycolatopsis vancoresmycina TaxID=208444 RepID=UPI000A7525DC|nr:maleylpyruvate isomerase N-terminal domain-containing protein [Amycolatopsis vancoresmycina]